MLMEVVEGIGYIPKNRNLTGSQDIPLICCAQIHIEKLEDYHWWFFKPLYFIIKYCCNEPHKVGVTNLGHDLYLTLKTLNNLWD